MGSAVEGAGESLVDCLMCVNSGNIYGICILCFSAISIMIFMNYHTVKIMKLYVDNGFITIIIVLFTKTPPKKQSRSPCHPVGVSPLG